MDMSKFTSACLDGNVNLVETLWQSSDFDFSWVVTHSSMKGYLNMLEWIWHRVGEYELHDAFQNACAYGHVNIAEWIWTKSQGRVTLNAFIYNVVVFKQDKNMLEWIASVRLIPIDIQLKSLCMYWYVCLCSVCM
jgi:hypothetical protein